MKILTYFFVVCLCVFFSFCKPQKEKDSNANTSDKIIASFSLTPRIESPEQEAECQRAVLFEGSRDAYDLLYYTFGHPKILPWALIMANKYGDEYACYNVFFAFARLVKNNTEYSLDHLDDETRNMAIGYLKKALERGNYNHASILADYYFEGKYLPQDSVIGKRIKELRDEWWARCGTDSTYVKTPFVFE